MNEIGKFVEWLKKQPRLNSSTVGKYSRAIIAISYELNTYDLLPEGTLYKITDPNRLEELKATYLLVPEFAHKDKSGNRMYSCALNYLIKYIKTTESETIITTPNLDVEIKNTSINGNFAEGKVTQVLVDRFERSIPARTACIAERGCVCLVCGLEFGMRYGKVANGFIHVHHLNPLSSVYEEYEVNPTIDLIPVCANCHSVIHMKNPPYTIEEVSEMIKTASNCRDSSSQL